LPILLVGVGSIAPALVGEILNRIKYAVDEEAKKRFIVLNAGKFLTGYILGFLKKKKKKKFIINLLIIYLLFSY
jgi:hypothetical protein